MITTTHDEKGHQYYDSIYARGYATDSYYPLYQQVLKMIEQGSTPKRVLEIGCGVGDLGKLIVERGYEYRGFDFSPVAVECSRALCPQADFRVGDAYNPASYLPHDYATAIALEVLEHLDDLRMIENVPAGVRLIASVPDYDDVAHLRLYKNPQRDILERFKPLLNVTDIVSLTGQGQTGEPKTIYLFQGIRLAAQESTECLDRKAELEGGAPVGRNDPCPCGSGKKYKKCCLP